MLPNKNFYVFFSSEILACLCFYAVNCGVNDQIENLLMGFLKWDLKALSVVAFNKTQKYTPQYHPS